ncbi:autotransporter outer membrane beta-barrel domain-containing protein, partial [Phyllobacterium salinisoli]
MEGGATISTGDASAISLSDNASITVRSGGTVQNRATTSPDGGYYLFGHNTVEFRANGSLVVESGGQILSTGPIRNAEAVNVIGGGNTITNHGLISDTSGPAIWFENNVGTNIRNTVDNYGTIEAASGGNVIGSSGPGALDFYNRETGIVRGDLVLGGGDDRLYLYTGSLLTGSLNGGGGTDTITLRGTGSESMDGAIRGFEVLNKDDSGTWELTGTITGNMAVTVAQGTLIVSGNNAAFTGTMTVDPAGILQGTATSLTPVITNNGLVRFQQNSNGTYGGLIQGSGAVNKSGLGVLILSGANTYGGGTNINEGTIAVGADNALGASTGSLTFAGGTLQFNSAFDLSQSRAITLNSPGGTIDTQAFTTTITQAIAGPGALTKSGNGILVLTGENTYAGGTEISAGTLQLGDGGTAGSIVGDVLNDGTLTFNRSGTMTFAGKISGTGAVHQIGSGVTVLTGENTYAGGTEISAGTLQLGDGGTAGSIVGDVLNDGTLTFNRSGT